MGLSVNTFMDIGVGEDHTNNGQGKKSYTNWKLYLHCYDFLIQNGFCELELFPLNRDKQRDLGKSLITKDSDKRHFIKNSEICSVATTAIRLKLFS